jgi:hypothetical protein
MTSQQNVIAARARRGHMQCIESGGTKMKKLIDIQSKLKAPKGQYNSFGRYNYRSAEDILEAAKPLLFEAGCQLTLSDAVEECGGRIYVKATAELADTDTGEAVSVSAYAREAENKKGMDDSQITGTASSYARKYALNGLFLIDDTKDSDTDEYRATEQQQFEQKVEDDLSQKISMQDAKNLIGFAEASGAVDMNKFKQFYSPMGDMTRKDLGEAYAMIKQKKEARDAAKEEFSTPPQVTFDDIHSEFEQTDLGL